MMHMIPIALAAAVILMPVTAVAQERQIERVFAPGGSIQLDLSAGSYEIAGSPDDRIRVVWQTEHPEDLDDVQVSVNVRGATANISTDGPSNNFRVRIELPRRSNIVLELSAGELRLRGIEGHKDISARAGEISIATGGRNQYRRVSASVRIGALEAGAFDVSKGGLFRSFNWTGTGHYDLKAHLTVGELNLRD